MTTSIVLIMIFIAASLNKADDNFIKFVDVESLG